MTKQFCDEPQTQINKSSDVKLHLNQILTSDPRRIWSEDLKSKSFQKIAKNWRGNHTTTLLCFNIMW